MDVLYLEPQATLMRRGTMSPFLLVFLVRLTTCVGEEFPVVSETRNLLKIGGDHLAANPIRWGGDPWSAKPFSLERVTHLMRIQFALKAEIL